MPVQNRAYWTKKVARNQQRDETAQACLRTLGWKVLVLWECELKDARRVGSRVKSFLKDE